jgi:hypothetical protein
MHERDTSILAFCIFLSHGIDFLKHVNLHDKTMSIEYC